MHTIVSVCTLNAYAGLYKCVKSQKRTSVCRDGTLKNQPN